MAGCTPLSGDWGRGGRGRQFRRRTFFSWVVGVGGISSIKRGKYTYFLGFLLDGKQILILEESKELVSGRKGSQPHQSALLTEFHHTVCTYKSSRVTTIKWILTDEFVSNGFNPLIKCGQQVAGFWTAFTNLQRHSMSQKSCKYEITALSVHSLTLD